jgi:hypothetical protein
MISFKKVAFLLLFFAGIIILKSDNNAFAESVDKQGAVYVTPTACPQRESEGFCGNGDDSWCEQIDFEYKSIIDKIIGFGTSETCTHIDCPDGHIESVEQDCRFDRVDYYQCDEGVIRVTYTITSSTTAEPNN